MNRIYMDHAATTPLHPAVREAMASSLDVYGNPSSVHGAGRDAKAVVRQARDSIAMRLGCSPNELVFTSGGSESDNAAIFGVLWSRWLKLQREGISDKKPHMITTAIEHHAVLHAAQQAERLGFEVTYVQPDQTGFVRLEDIEAAVKAETCLISVMYANNEVGTIQPIEAIGRMARERGILMHTDAVQALGIEPLHLNELPIDFASFSAHKVNGPKGIGAMYCKHGAEWEPFIYGGSQERKRRAGTENIVGIAGFGAAAAQAYESLDARLTTIREVRAALWNGLKSLLGDRVVLNGDEDHSVPHILNVSILDVPTETMLMNLDMLGIQVSSGSACTSGSLEVSHVLQAMKLSAERTSTAVRFSLGMGNTKEQAEAVVKHIETIVSRVRTRN
ncbi:cysteine desulfurase family protein [Paenibacillus marinisediminis]